MIIKGRFKIYPREIEEIIHSYPEVTEVAVIGVHDEVWEESVKAIIVAKDEVSLTEEEIVELCMKKLASYKKLKSLKFVNFLPMKNQGKILKGELKA